MGASASSESAAATQFASLYDQLPDDVHDQIEALCEKSDTRLLGAPRRTGAAPNRPHWREVRLSQQVAAAALATVRGCSASTMR